MDKTVKYQVLVLLLLASVLFLVFSSYQSVFRSAGRFRDAIGPETTLVEILRWPEYWHGAVAYPAGEHRIHHIALHDQSIVFANSEEHFDNQEAFRAAVKKHIEESNMQWKLSFTFERLGVSRRVHFLAEPDGRLHDVLGP